VDAAFRDFEGEYELYTTAGPMDACEKIKKEAETGAQLRVYACGGDGTLNECVCGAVGRENVAVTHYPTGTGNDFIKTFGPECVRFRSLPELLRGEVRPLDAIDCNGRACVNICSVGIDARIGTDVHKYSSLPLLGGAAGYVTSTVVNLIKGIRTPMRIQCGMQRFEGDMTLVCACNGSFYGGGFHPVPEARPDDGALEFLVVPGVSRLTFAKVVGAYAKGKYADYPKLIHHLRGSEIEIAADAEFVVNVDGEAMFTSTLRLRLLPGAVNFLVPADLAYFHGKRPSL
jgi:YegS/Rv2252/BmrU family lipid kinase